MIDYSVLKFSKQPSKVREQERKTVKKESISKAVKRAVMERDLKTCRVCGKPAESVHELRFRSLGGAVSLKNSIATCGDGTRGCHGQLQRNELTWVGNPNGKLRFFDNKRKRATA